MERVQWTECCLRYEALWRTARMGEDTIAAWWEEFGVWADYALAMRALSRLSTDHERPPALAVWREVHGVLVRERAANERSAQGARVEDGPGTASWERRRRLGKEWMQINDYMHDEALAAMFDALQRQCKTPFEPTDAEAQMAREALLDEIRARGIQRIPRGDPRRAEKKPRDHKSDLTRLGVARRHAGYPMGCDTPHKQRMHDLYGPGKKLPWDIGAQPSERGSAPPRAQHAYCRSGSRCVISANGYGAALSPLTGRDYCLPCQERRRTRNA